MADPLPPWGSESTGAPVGRRVVLGLVALGGLGVLMGSRVSRFLTALAERDPTGLTALIPGNGGFRFYSVVARVQQTPPEAYRLRVDGLVANPGQLTMDELAALPQATLTRDVQCVTGWRVEDVTWSGVRLADLLDTVGADGTASAVLFGSSDGAYSESLTMEQARREDVLIATAMDGAPVSHAHGGPVRLYVAPMYFYKSLKWLDHITVAERVVPGYWEQRGYDVDAWVGRSNGRSDAPIT